MDPENSHQGTSKSQPAFVKLSEYCERTKSASIIKRIMTAERKNEAFGRLKYYCEKSQQSQAIDAVTVPALWTTQGEDDTSPLEDPKNIYKTRHAHPSACVEIKIPPEIYIV